MRVMTIRQSTSRHPYLSRAVTVILVVLALFSTGTSAPHHDPHGVLASWARLRADSAMVAALDDVTQQLPLGTSTGTAVYDTCRATRPASLDYSITCERRRYRVYPLTAAAADAHSLARRLSHPWRQDGGFCDADLELDTVCLRANDLALEFLVQSELTTYPIQGPPEGREVMSTVIDSTGYYLLDAKGPSIVVKVSSTYYVG
jgi:hypothetical protein